MERHRGGSGGKIVKLWFSPLGEHLGCVVLHGRTGTHGTRGDPVESEVIVCTAK